MALSYPIIANCNFESRSDTAGKTIHKIRKDVEAGLTENKALVEALEELESTLLVHAESDMAFSIEACEAAEKAVIDAWTAEVQAEVEAARQSRYRD